VIKIVRDTARKARTSAIITLKALIITAPAELREQLTGLSDKPSSSAAPWRADRPGCQRQARAATLAKRYQVLDREIRDHDTILDDLTRATAHTPREALGIGADTAAEMLIVFGDNRQRVRSRPHSPSSATPAPSRHPPA
jgi:hypothetical protein